MILLLSPYQNAPECAAQVERATRDKVQIVETIRLAMSALRSQQFTMMIADENLIESTPGTSESLLQRMETSVPLIVDLASMRPEKVAKVAVTTLKRRVLEFEMARKQAVAELRSEMKSDITGLLISSELALKAEKLPSPTTEKLNVVLEIARRMHSRLSAV
jgi:hypothetical protein